MDNIVRKTLFLVAALCIALTTLAQNHLSGTLTDGKSGESLMYVNCVLLKAQDSTFAYGTTSDEKGRFTFKQVATGNYLLRVSFIGPPIL